MYLTKSQLFNKNIILRTDYNVPIYNGIIQSTRRIDASLQTIKFIINKKPSKIIIISHLGRPNGYDKNLYNLVNKISTVPIIGLGGCGIYEDINSANEETNLSAYASGSAFCFFNRTNEVLINYPEQSYINNLLI